jgi:hypothetical protein
MRSGYSVLHLSTVSRMQHRFYCDGKKNGVTAAWAIQPAEADTVPARLDNGQMDAENVTEKDDQQPMTPAGR